MSAPGSAQVAKHSSATAEHYTPAPIVEAARALMGGIDLDPASCARANKIVKARRFLTKFMDGLDPRRRWSGRVWLNPPGGKLRNRSVAKLFWARLVRAWLDSEIEQAVFLGFNLEILSSSQDCVCSAIQFPICVPRKRIAFLYDAGASAGLKVGGGPTHANVICWLPPMSTPGVKDLEMPIALFRQHFGFLGECK